MRHALPLNALFALGLAVGAAPASAAPVPATDATALVAAAELIVVGRVEGLSVRGGAAPTQAFSLTVDRVLKGGVAPRRQIVVRLDLSSPASSGVAERQYGAFLLQREGAAFTAVDASHPALPASPSGPAGDGRPGDPASAVAKELAAVLATPAAILVDPIDGVGSQVIGPAAARADETYSDAAQAIATLPYDAAGAPLVQLARSGPESARIWALAALFRIEGPDALGATRLALLNELAPALAKAARPSLPVDTLARALDGSRLGTDAVPTLAVLLKATHVGLRRAAAALLGDIGTVAVVAPLGIVALEDSDQEVRYQAVLGLAAATGRGEAPALARYQQSESRYLTSWRAFARTLKR